MPPREHIVGKLRPSQPLQIRMHQLVRATARELRQADPAPDGEYQRYGLTNEQIVKVMLPEAQNLCRPEFNHLVAAWCSVLVPAVLGGSADGNIPMVVDPILPGLEIPQWLSIPRPTLDKGKPGWKHDRDTSPNQLNRLIGHRNEFRRGYEVETQKYILLRDTALKLHCEPDDPISTVFPDRRQPPRGAAQPMAFL